MIFFVLCRDTSNIFWSRHPRQNVRYLCPCSILNLSLSVYLSIQLCRRFRGVFFIWLRLLSMNTPLTCRLAAFGLQNGFVLLVTTGFAPALACNIVGRSARSCQIVSTAPLCRCLVVLLGVHLLLLPSGCMASAWSLLPKVLAPAWCS